MDDLLPPPESAGLPWSKLTEAGYRVITMYHHRPGQLTVCIESDKDFFLQKGPDTPAFWTRLEVKAGIEKRSALPKKEVKKADPRHQEFIAEWMGAYRGFFNRDYSVSMPQDGATLKRFLSSNKQPVAELIKVAQEAWQYRLDNPFCKECKRAGSISAFCNAWNDINTELDSSTSNNKPVSRL